jgi:hypothetical protein
MAAAQTGRDIEAATKKVEAALFLEMRLVLRWPMANSPKKKRRVYIPRLVAGSRAGCRPTCAGCTNTQYLRDIDVIQGIFR